MEFYHQLKQKVHNSKDKVKLHFLFLLQLSTFSDEEDNFYHIDDMILTRKQFNELFQTETNARRNGVIEMVKIFKFII